jgi:hypothetical protein
LAPLHCYCWNFGYLVANSNQESGMKNILDFVKRLSHKVEIVRSSDPRLKRTQYIGWLWLLATEIALAVVALWVIFFRE